MNSREQVPTFQLLTARHRLILVLLAAVLGVRTLGATPPTLVNYQGVLRSSLDAPLTGSYDMLFRFWDAPTGGVEIMIDQHAAVTGNAVTVTGGLFDALLGGGTVSDGSGPGTYTSLDALFRDHSDVWLEVRIGNETLAPRTRIQSTPYALNATNAVSAVSATSAGDSTQLAGQPASFYLDTSATAQTKLGQVVFDNASGTGMGIEATGPDGGGFFSDSDDSGYAYLGYQYIGILASGEIAGWFNGDSGSVDSEGVRGVGYGLGGIFYDGNDSGVARLGFGNYGVYASGSTTGGYFRDDNATGYAHVGRGDVGIEGYGGAAGGYFGDINSTGFAYVGVSDFGIQGYGNVAGGYFDDLNSAGWAYVGFSTYKIQGSGTVSFVQNHPTQKDRVLVYAAPEGDEVAVYTRGSGRLAAGRTEVALGDTFRHVANPDLGLTAHVTPRGGACPLYVAAVSTERMTVAADDPTCAGADFDYIVYGLRIGFEALPIVQAKTREAYLPTAATLSGIEAGQTDAVASSALARFRSAHERLTGAPADLSRGSALAAQINTGREEWLAARAQHEEQRRAARAEERETSEAPLAPLAQRSQAEREPKGGPAGRASTVETAAEFARPAGTTLVLQAAEAIETGDVVSLDPLHPGVAVRSSAPGEPLIVGCTLASGDGQVELATAGVALCRADSAVAPIEVGDLLIASTLAGHAMKHDGSLPTSAILGRAVDPLPVGAGLIRVLLGAR